MNNSRAFSYVFEDKNWFSKLVIAGLIGLIPIVGQFYLTGWTIEIIRRTKAGRKDILPTTHFSYFLTLGLKSFVVTLIYMIPVIIVTSIITLTAETRSYGDGSFTIVFTSTSFFGNLITLLVQICCGFLVTYGMIKMAETDEIKGCLNFSDAYNTIKNNLSAFIIVALLTIVSSIIGFAGIILCFIGLIFTYPYSLAINGYLMGNLWLHEKPAQAAQPRVRTQTPPAAPSEEFVEAPFTKVQDIENDAAAAQPKASSDDVIVVEVPKEAVQKAEDVLQAVSDKAETAAENISAKVETAAENISTKAGTAASYVDDVISNVADNAAKENDTPEETPADGNNNSNIPPFE